ncbi:MAG: hypothetical protein IH859_05640 [Chloroflexi bacterium]|nr:hypothetical protein [Chloroflexota bacterium]
MDSDLRYVQTVITELKSYLLSDEMYWPVRLGSMPREESYPALTPGNLLLFRARLRGRRDGGELEHAQRVALLEMEEQLDALTQAWRVAWEGKLGREIKSRMKQWKLKLDEISADPANRSGYYNADVRERVLIELLVDEIGEQAPVEVELLSTLDERLRALTVDGEFLWEDELQGMFRIEKYWYLYRTLRQH